MEYTKLKIVLASLLILFLLSGCTGKNQANRDLEDESKEKANTESMDCNTEKKENGFSKENSSKTGVWSPDRKWVAVTYSARTWIDTVILEVDTNKEYETGVFKYITLNAEKYSYKIGGNQRPDPYINFLEWSPDSKKLLLSYGFFDDDYIRQTGITVFNLEKMEVEWLMKLAPAEGEHADIKKPEGFNWESRGYG